MLRIGPVNLAIKL